MRPTISDLTATEKDALYAAFDASVTPQAIADVIRLRRAPTITSRTADLQFRLTVARGCADDATQAIAALIERRDAATTDWMRDRLNQAIARRTSEYERYMADVVSIEAQIAAFTIPQQLAAE